MFDFKIKIGGSIIRFMSDNPDLEYIPGENKEFTHFIYEGTDDPNVTFAVHYGTVPEFSRRVTLFKVDDSWSLSASDDAVLFEYADRGLPGRYERVGRIDLSLTKGTIYVNREKTPEEQEESKRLREVSMTDEQRARREERQRQREARKGARAKSTATAFPEKRRVKKEKTPAQKGQRVMAEIKANFFQAFLVEYLVKHRLGFLAHCSTVRTNGHTYLFMGQTRAGKSTIADLWITHADAKVPNDDRAILSVRDGMPFFENAPWIGDLIAKCTCSHDDAFPVDRIFFLNGHGRNELKKMSTVEAATKIFKNSFPVFWDKDSLGYVFDLCATIASKVPCYDLSFTNDNSAVAYIQNALVREH